MQSTAASIQAQVNELQDQVRSLQADLASLPLPGLRNRKKSQGTREREGKQRLWTNRIQPAEEELEQIEIERLMHRARAFCETTEDVAFRTASGAEATWKDFVGPYRKYLASEAHRKRNSTRIATDGTITAAMAEFESVLTKNVKEELEYVDHLLMSDPGNQHWHTWRRYVIGLGGAPQILQRRGSLSELDRLAAESEQLNEMPIPPALMQLAQELDALPSTSQWTASLTDNLRELGSLFDTGAAAGASQTETLRATLDQLSTLLLRQAQTFRAHSIAVTSGDVHGQVNSLFSALRNCETQEGSLRMMPRSTSPATVKAAYETRRKDAKAFVTQTFQAIESDIKGLPHSNKEKEKERTRRWWDIENHLQDEYREWKSRTQSAEMPTVPSGTGTASAVGSRQPTSFLSSVE